MADPQPPEPPHAGPTNGPEPAEQPVPVRSGDVARNARALRRFQWVAAGTSGVLLTLLTWTPGAPSCPADNCGWRPLVAFAADPESSIAPSPVRDGFRILVFAAVLALLLPVLAGRAPGWRRRGPVAGLLAGPVATLVSLMVWASAAWFTALTRSEAIDGLAEALYPADAAALQGLFVGGVAGLVATLAVRPPPGPPMIRQRGARLWRGPLITLGVAVLWWAVFGNTRYELWAAQVRSASRFEPGREDLQSPVGHLLDWLTWPRPGVFVGSPAEALEVTTLLVAAATVVAGERWLRTWTGTTWRDRVLTRWLVLGYASLLVAVGQAARNAAIAALNDPAMGLGDRLDHVFIHLPFFLGSLGLALAVPIPLVALLATAIEAAPRLRTEPVPVLARRHPAGAVAVVVALVAAAGLAGFAARWQPDPRIAAAAEARAEAEGGVEEAERDPVPQPSPSPSAPPIVVPTAAPGEIPAINWSAVPLAPQPSNITVPGVEDAVWPGTWDKDGIVKTLTCPPENSPPEVGPVAEADLNRDGKPEVLVAAACLASTSSWPSELLVFDGAPPVGNWRRIGVLLDSGDGLDDRGLRIQRIEVEDLGDAFAIVVISRGFRTTDDNASGGTAWVWDRLFWDEFGWARGGRRVA